MIKTGVIFLLLTTITQGVVDSNNDSFISTIENLLQNFEYNGIISAFLCQQRDSLTILKKFAREFHQVNIFSLDEDIAYPIPSNQVVFLLDLQCDNIDKFLLKINSMKLFSSPFKWIIFSRTYLAPDWIDDYFKGIDILVDSDVTVAIMQESDLYSVQKIFKQHQKGPIHINDVTSKEQHIDLAKQRKNLQGTILNTCIVITHNDSLNHLTDKRDRHIDSIAKVNYVLVQHLADIVNATLKYSVKNTWGYKDNTSRWSGMIGALTRKEADIGGTALFLTSDRISIIDYIAMTTPTRSKFIFRQPKLSYVANVFVLPFDLFVWISIYALFMILIIVLYVIVKWEWRRNRVGHTRRGESDSPIIHASWLEVALITFGALCQQGTAATPLSSAGRIALIFLFVSFMFLYTSYSANIVALLQSSSTNIQTLQDILNSRLEVGVDDTVFNHFYFPNASEPVRRALYLQKVAPPGQKPHFYQIEEGISRLRAGLFAFHVETGPAYKIVGETFREDEKCGLQEIEFLQVPDPWLAIQKNSSYKEMLKIGLHLLQENGIQAREVSLIYTKKPQCLSRGSSFISVGLVDCYMAMAIIAGGLVGAPGILLLEIYVKKRLVRRVKVLIKTVKGTERN